MTIKVRCVMLLDCSGWVLTWIVPQDDVKRTVTFEFYRNSTMVIFSLCLFNNLWRAIISDLFHDWEHSIIDYGGWPQCKTPLNWSRTGKPPVVPKKLGRRHGIKKSSNFFLCQRLSNIRYKNFTAIQDHQKAIFFNFLKLINTDVMQLLGD